MSQIFFSLHRLMTMRVTVVIVTHFSLYNFRELKDPFSQTWFLNISLFETFKELRSLDLYYHGITSWIKNNDGMLASYLFYFYYLHGLFGSQYRATIFIQINLRP